MIIPEMPLFPKGEPAFVDLLKQHEPFIPRWADKSTVEKMGVQRLEFSHKAMFLSACFACYQYRFLCRGCQ